MDMLSVAEAQRAILATIQPLETESVELLNALGRVLAADVRSDVDLPPFDNSSMDGYALQARDVIGATPDRSVRLPVVADIPAGHPSPIELTAGTAARITTGAVLPRGADAVVPVEDTDDDARGAHPLPDSIGVRRAVKSGDFVRYAGDDVRRGERVLAASTLIRPAEIALLAAVGQARVPVYRQPHVALLATGDELVEPNQAPGPGQIRNVNAYATAALVAQYGGVPLPLGIAADRFDAVTAKLESAIEQGADLIVASAGVSVGAYDLVKDAVAAHGAIDLWRVRMRPGKPLAFGNYRGVPFFGLPGNPVSAMLTFEQFVRPVLRVMAGLAQWHKPTIEVIVQEAIDSDGRETYARAWVERVDGHWQARLSGGQGSNMLSSLVRANALVIVPDGVRRLDAGSAARAQMLDWPDYIDWV
ncbi:MAG: molybdopterin molybdotransferase MoeA [Chloroflexi bacterium]|nr:molybdopterin molybdotransferase MoeA [Chloroflexota bacterium]